MLTAGMASPVAGEDGLATVVILPSAAIFVALETRRIRQSSMTCVERCGVAHQDTSSSGFIYVSDLHNAAKQPVRYP